MNPPSSTHVARLTRSVSLVIPAFNEERLLPRTLTHARTASQAFVERGWKVETIVCNNRSTDRTAEVARDHGATVVYEAINQIGRARNTGAAAATGDWILFLDADSAPTRELFEATAREIERGDRVFVGAVVRLDADLGWSGNALLGLWNLASRCLRWMAGSFVAVEAAAFRAVGGFDHALYAGEELDLSRRLKAFGRRDGRTYTILTRHPILSSARRLKLYRRTELLRFFAQATLRPFHTPRSKEACAMWYDGKR